jgi:hypothetical protein
VTISFSKTYKIIWPEYQLVPAAKIKMWYEDSVANGDAINPHLTNVDAMALDLHHAGHITLGKD